mgnify:CR=1 FL=1
MILRRLAPLGTVDEAGRTVFGRIVPYGEVTTVTEGRTSYQEMFAPGAFAKSIRDRGHKVRLFAMHKTDRFPLGRATELIERGDGVHATFTLARTRDADEALELITTGAVDAFSIGFRPIRSRQRNGVVVREEAALFEVSLVHTPAYDGARVAGVRSANVLSADVARRQLELILTSW